MRSIREMLSYLTCQGCYPCLSYRGGNVWRAHVNGAGNHWCDAADPSRALEEAIENWKKAGKPKDGYADGGL